jgi:hypothetical protein
MLGVVAAVLAGVLGVGARPAGADGVQHFSLLAETMHPVDSRMGYDSTSGYLTTTSSSSLPAAYVGQLNLPDGATIVGVQAFGMDSDFYSEFYFHLFRLSLQTDPVSSPVTNVGHSGVAYSAGKIVVSATVNSSAAVIDNAQYSYGIYLVLPRAVAGYGPLGVLRFLVDTNYPVALPAVMQNPAH